MSPHDTNPTRRVLNFRELDEAVREAEALHLSGYDRLGQWNLAQICGHLARWIRFPVEGYPPLAPPMRAMGWLMRHTVGPRMLRRTLARGTMPAGGPTLPQTVPDAGEDEAEALARFREAVQRFQTHSGPLHPSPLFGPLDRETWTRFQLIHCAHHLGFLQPKAGARRAA